MSSLYAKDCVDLALSEVGYQCGANKWNKYADDLDAVDYFTGCGKKQNLDFCAVFVCWLIWKCLKGGQSIWAAHYFLYQSDSCCMAAVVKYLAQYFKDNGAYFTDPKNLERADIVIFQNSKGPSHTGIVVSWGSSTFDTVEGNTGGGKVLRRTYSYSEIGGRVAGFCRPRYDGWEAPTSKPDTKAKPETKPAEPKKSKSLRVDTQSGTLTIRVAPNTRSASIGAVPKGTILTELAITNGEFIHGDNTWIRSTYNGVTGWLSGYYLTRV